jgi:hypothetical protein
MLRLGIAAAMSAADPKTGGKCPDDSVEDVFMTAILRPHHDGVCPWVKVKPDLTIP